MKKDKSIYITVTIKPWEVNRQLSMPNGFIAGDTAKKAGYLFIQFSNEKEFDRAINIAKSYIATVLE